MTWPGAQIERDTEPIHIGPRGRRIRTRDSRSKYFNSYIATGSAEDVLATDRLENGRATGVESNGRRLTRD